VLYPGQYYHHGKCPPRYKRCFRQHRLSCVILRLHVTRSLLSSLYITHARHARDVDVWLEHDTLAARRSALNSRSDYFVLYYLLSIVTPIVFIVCSHVLRVNREGDYVMVLGSKVFKETSSEEWPLHAWGHIYHCYSCLRTACKTMDEVISMNRFALFSETALSQSCIKYEYGFDGAKELILAGFIPSDIPLSSPRHSIICVDSGSQSFRPM